MKYQAHDALFELVASYATIKAWRSSRDLEPVLSWSSIGQILSVTLSNFDIARSFIAVPFVIGLVISSCFLQTNKEEAVSFWKVLFEHMQKVRRLALST